MLSHQYCTVLYQIKWTTGTVCLKIILVKLKLGVTKELFFTISLTFYRFLEEIDPQELLACQLKSILYSQVDIHT